MNKLINVIMTELRRLFVEKLIILFFEGISGREFMAFILGMICTILMQGIVE